MAARLDSVVRYICEAGEWRVTNLQLQKIFYILQMYYMGQHEKEQLADARFQAWDYGPVEPSLYRRVRMFGSDPVEDVFAHARHFNLTDDRRKPMDEVCDALLPMSAGELVNITHWHKGAWAKNYVPGIKGIPIPDADIAAEYIARARDRQVIGA